MRRTLTAISAIGLGLVAAAARADTIVLDRSPAATGGSGTPSYSNKSTSQNLAERVRFDDAVLLTGMDIYSSATGVLGQDATIRVWADASGEPGSLLHNFSETISALDGDGATSGNTRKHVDFSAPLALSAGVDYWVGMSGSSVDIGQLGMWNNPYDDSLMAKFSGTSFSGMVSTGDMAFRLYGDGDSPVPTPSAAVGLAGLGAAAVLIGLRRRRSLAA